MAILDVKTQHIQVYNRDLAVNAYLAMQTEEGLFPSIILVQEIFEVNSHIRELNERIAKQNCVEIAPAIYQLIAPRSEEHT